MYTYTQAHRSNNSGLICRVCACAFVRESAFGGRNGFCGAGGYYEVVRLSSTAVVGRWSIEISEGGLIIRNRKGSRSLGDSGNVVGALVRYIRSCNPCGS